MAAIHKSENKFGETSPKIIQRHETLISMETGVFGPLPHGRFRPIRELYACPGYARGYLPAALVTIRYLKYSSHPVIMCFKDARA